MLNIKESTEIRHYHLAHIQKNLDFIFYGVIPLILVVIWYLMPIISIIPILVYLAFIKPPKTLLYFFLILIASVFGLINYTKVPESDLLSYYNWLDDFLAYSIFEFYKVKLLDPAFYLPTSMLSHATSASGPMFILFWTTITYFVAFLALVKFSKLIKLKPYLTFAVIGHVAFFGYNFGLSGHLVRQYAAMSFLLLSFVVALSGDKRSYYLFIIAVLLHHSAIVYLPVIYFTNLREIKISRFYFLVLVMFVISIVFGSNNLFIYLANIPVEGINVLAEVKSKSALYEEKNDGEVGIRILLEFLIYTLMLMYLVYSKLDDLGIKLLFLLLFFWSIVILTRSTDLLLLRYYFYGFGIMSLVLVYIAKSNVKLLFLFILLLFFTSIPRFIRAIGNSNWTYISNDFNIVFNTVYHMIIAGQSIH